MHDAKIMYNQIVDKLGVANNQVKKCRVFQNNFWYAADKKNTVLDSLAVSNTLEAAFGKVGDLYMEHQNTWDNSAEVEDAASEDEEEDMDEDENDDI